MKKVTFGITNCNRLFYLKSCLESLLECTSDYENKEIIIVDNASIEEGTEEYLREKEAQGIKVFRQEKRDPANEFAKALNLIYENATGEYVCPLQGDMQFVVKGKWLEKYVSYCDKYSENVGSLSFDAQRKIRIDQHMPYNVFAQDDLNAEFPFYIDIKRPPIQGAADSMYPRWILEKIYPWNIKNEAHEGGPDSETAMLQKVKKLHEEGDIKNVFTIIPKFPVAVAIYTDQRGTMGRVRGNKRYGDYWEAKKDNLYYELIDYDDVLKMQSDNNFKPLPIELLARGVEWNPPVDENGHWKKNPIRPETATEADYVVLYDEEV